MTNLNDELIASMDQIHGALLDQIKINDYTHNLLKLIREDVEALRERVARIERNQLRVVE